MDLPILRPMGFAALIWSMRTLRETYKPTQKACLDIHGFLLFTLFLFSMAMGLTMMMNAAKWLSEAILSMILAAILFTLFIAHERRGRFRALGLSIFRNLQFTGGIIAQFLYSMGFSASLILIVIFLEALGNYSASLTGLLITPFELSFLVFGVVGGRISDKKGFEMPIITGLLLAGANLLMLSGISAATSPAYVIGATIILGIGAGLFIAPQHQLNNDIHPTGEKGDRLSNKNTLLQHRIPDKPKHSSNITCPSNFI